MLKEDGELDPKAELDFHLSKKQKTLVVEEVQQMENMRGNYVKKKEKKSVYVAKSQQNYSVSYSFAPSPCFSYSSVATSSSTNTMSNSSLQQHKDSLPEEQHSVNNEKTEKPAKSEFHKVSKKDKEDKVQKTQNRADWKRKWVPFHQKDLPSDCNRLTLLSYNVLSDDGTKNTYLYPFVPPKCLEWKERFPKLIAEIKALAADIVCLQEVDRFQEVDEKMKELGYKGTFKRRTGSFPDGCAVFYKHQKFEEVYREVVEFNIRSNPGFEWMDRDNVAVVLVLKLRQTEESSKVDEEKEEVKQKSTSPSKICICTTHLLWNPKRGDLKLAQLQLLLGKLKSITNSSNQPIPLLLCGDFNCTPDSAMFQFLQTGQLDLRSVDIRTASGQATKLHSFVPVNKQIASLLCQGTGPEMRHDLQLTSAYRPDGLVSTMHNEFRGNVDYIFSNPLLRCTGILTLPTLTACRQGQLGPGLPNERFASDHLSLKAEFVLLPFSKQDQNYPKEQEDEDEDDQ